LLPFCYPITLGRGAMCTDHAEKGSAATELSCLPLDRVGGR